MSKSIFVTVGTTKFDRLINVVTDTAVLQVIGRRSDFFSSFDRCEQFFFVWTFTQLPCTVYVHFYFFIAYEIYKKRDDTLSWKKCKINLSICSMFTKVTHETI